MINSAVRINPLTEKDLHEVGHLQPEGWQDILPTIRSYCQLDFCAPLKATLENKLVGIGTAIFHEFTAWLGHIIVHKDYRNAGIGRQITRSLIHLVQKTPCKSTLLIATSLGEPVYKKLGFEVETQYLFLENNSPIRAESTQEIKTFKKKYEKTLLALDYLVSGEKRQKLFQDHFAKAQVYFEDSPQGFYLPTLGEGLIVADTPEAGLALMKKRFGENQKVCLPVENQVGIEFLLKNGFKESRRASRMVLGERLSWQGSKMYSRIGGNLG